MPLSRVQKGKLRARDPPRVPPPSAADFYVNHLPGLSPESQLTLFGGNLPSSPISTPPSRLDSDAHLYFLLARGRHIPNKQRLIIWLNGGPGCSSFDGALLENGPIRINEDGTVREVDGTQSWNEYASVLYIDEPAGTGYSYVTKNDNVRELSEAADQIVTFLSNFYQIFPEYEFMDTYIAGESYAGQYIPYIADAIERTTVVQTRLKGLLIGNGWIDPRAQYPAYLDYLLQRKILTKGSKGYRDVLLAVEKCTEKMNSLCEKDVTGKGTILVPECEEILNAVTQATKKGNLCMNSYDTNLFTECGADWPEGVKQVTKFLQREDVTKSLHADTGPRRNPWEQCSNAVGAKFWTPKSSPSVQLLPKLLETIPILLYAGENDLMCAGTGIEQMIANLTWNGEIGFGSQAEKLDWTVNSTKAGTWQFARNLTYVSIFNASHMVPMSQPLAAHDMLLRFMQVDTLHAAGAAAKIPSKIGDEIEAVLGVKAPNGTSLQTIPVEVAAGADATSLADLHDGFNLDHEREFGPRRTIVLFVLLLAIGIGLWACLRFSKGKRNQRKGNKLGSRSRDVERGGDYQDLEQTDADEVLEIDQKSHPAEIFDLGREDESDDFDEWEQEDEDTETAGDISQANNPWQDSKNLG